MDIQQNVVNFRNIALTFIFFLWLLWLWSRRQYYAFAWRFPGKLGLPIIGSLYEVKHIDFILRKFGENIRGAHKTLCFWQGLHPCLLTIDTVVIEKVLSSPDYLEKGMPLYEPLDLVLGHGILTLPVKQWRLRRKNISVIFKQKTLLSLFPIINEAKNKMLDDFDMFANDEEHFVLETIIRHICALSVESTFNVKMAPNEEGLKSLVANFLSVLKMVALQIICTTFNLHGILRRYPKFQKVRNALIESIDNILKEKILEKEKTTKSLSYDESYENPMAEKPVILIDQIYKLYKEQKLSWNELLSDSFTFLTASLETTANTIYSALAFLATHAAVQETLFEEIYAVFPDKSVYVEHAHFEQLPYLEMVIQETLRLAPAFPTIARQINKPLKLADNQVAPSGMQLIIGIAFLHRAKDIWGDNAEQFQPERFLPETFSHIPAYAYIPFSKGARNCMGYRYAQLVLKVMLIGLVRNFKFDTNFKYEDIEFKFNVSSAFIKNPSLRIQRRL